MSFLDSLIGTESGGNWQARNNETGSGGMAGHFGRLQFGHARLQDAMNAGVLPRGTTPQQFMADPNLQMAVERWHFDDIDRQAQRMGLAQYVGQTVAGIPITQDAIRAMAHLGGINGAARFLQTGGQYNPADAYGTSLSDYARRHGMAGSGQGPAAPRAQPAGARQAPYAAPEAPAYLAPQNALAQAAVEPWRPTFNALDARAFNAFENPPQNALAQFFPSAFR